MSIFTGSGTAVCTPFDADGRFNEKAFEKLIGFQVQNGADAIVACGTTGEASTLGFDEHVAVVAAAAAITKQAAGARKVPVIAGAGGNDTRHCAKLGTALAAAGADALMYVTPYYNKTSQRGLVEHYTYLAAHTDVPIVIYNIAGRTGLNMLPSTFEKLCRTENIAAVKEASGNIVQVAEIAEACGDALDIYSGNDDYVLPILSLGGKGVISTLGNILPQTMHSLVTSFLNGDPAESRRIQLSILPIVRAIFADVNPMPVKTALNLMGFGFGACRPPLTTVDDRLREELIRQMRAFGLPLRESV